MGDVVTSNGTGGGNFQNTASWVGIKYPVDDDDSFVVAAGDTITMDGDFTIANDAAGTVNATGTLVVAGGFNLELATGGVALLTADGLVTVAGTLTAGAQGSINIGAAGEVAVTGTWAVTVGANIWVGGTLDIDIAAATLDGTFAGSGDIEIERSLVVVAGSTFTSTLTVTFDDAGANVDTIECNACPLPAVVVDNAGVTSLTLTEEMDCKGFTLTAGKFADGGYDVGVEGDLSLSAGILTSTGTWTQTGVGDVQATRSPGTMVFNGTATLVANFIITETIGGSGSIELQNFQLGLSNPGNDYWTFTGTITSTTGRVYLLFGASRSNAARFSLGAVGMYVYSSDNVTFTAGGGITTTGAVLVSAQAASKKIILSLGAVSSIGALTLGLAGGLDKAGGVKLNGNSLTLASLTAAVDPNTFELDSGYLSSPGTLNFTNITPSADADNVAHIVCAGAGEVTNFDPVQIVHCHGDTTVDGGGNNGVNGVTTFNTETHPGTRMMMLVGG